MKLQSKQYYNKLIKMSSYHLTEIPKGILKEYSKITEEYMEFMDAIQQDSKVLQLCELADLLGAIEAYTIDKFNLSLEDLNKMKELNKKAFLSGHRK